MKSIDNALMPLITGQPLSRCLVVAELGVNHNGCVDQARTLLDAALASGADAAKLQLYNAEALCSRVHRREETQMLDTLRLSDDEQASLCEYAHSIGLPLLATPFDSQSLQLLIQLEIPVIKVGSGEVTHTPFLAEIAATGRPVILSTGGCTWTDIERAVDVLRSNGCQRLSILHCVSAYPPPETALNLRMIETLRSAFPFANVGFSDHSVGINAGPAAVACGAMIIEKHLTLDRSAEGPDHAASADANALACMVRAIRRMEDMLGSGAKQVLACEGTIGRSIVADHDLPAGHVLSNSDLAYKRPGNGLRPHRWREIVGCELKREIKQDELIMANDVREVPLAVCTIED
jgi:N,N'-diacetyllegionaminate synthase